jgi:hypothetical protein
MKTSSRLHPAARAGTVLAFGAFSLVLTGCAGAMDAVADVVGGGDVYEITYEVSTPEPAANRIVDVSYMESDGRGQPSIVKSVDDAALASGDGAQTWSFVTYVTAEEKAFVQATPADGEALECRILIDGKEEIASSTAEAGQPVTCEVSTPPFD